MVNSLIIQIFLGLNLVLVGVVLAVAVRHAIAHFRPPQPPEEKSPRPHPSAQPFHLSTAAKERLTHEAEDKFQHMIEHSADELQHSLRITTASLNKQLDRLGSSVASAEMERYRTDLETLRQQTLAAIAGAQNEITTHQTELRSKMQEEIAAEKAALKQRIDTKLNDAVASFLLETLGHDVDLGAQSAYLTKLLETHKDELIKGIDDER